MLDYQLEIVGDELFTSIDHYEEFCVNLHCGRSIYRPMRTHMGDIMAILKVMDPVCNNAFIKSKTKAN